jgi:uncharacterized protein YbjT (DUF2867 family)
VADMSYTALVTGATGKVGRRLIPILAREGVSVRAASRSPLQGWAGIEPVRFDWSNPGTFEPARKGVDVMYLVPGPVPQAEHADWFAAFLDGAAAAGVRKVALLSVFGAGQAPPDNPLRRIELAVESSGVPFTIVRPAAIMQSFSEGLRWREELVEGIREHDEIRNPGGEGVVSYVAAEDVASVVAAALTRDGQEGAAYAPFGPEPLTLHQVAEHISWAAGRPIRYVETDAMSIRDALVAHGAPQATAEHNSKVYVQAYTSGVLGGTNDDVHRVTGRAPVSFGEFAVGAAAAWRR